MATATSKKPSKPAAKKAATKKEPTKKAAETTETSATANAAAPSSFKIYQPGESKPERVRASRNVASSYPFDQLAIGGAFEIPSDKDRDLYTSDTEFETARGEDLKTIANRMGGAVRRFKKSNPGKNFSIYKTSTSIMVERIADTEVAK